MDQDLIETVKKYYPYPIVSSFRTILTSDDLKEKPRKILDCAESIARFLGFISIAEIRKNLEINNIQAPSSLRFIESDANKKFSKPSFGTWVEFAREGFNWAAKNNLDITISELKYFFKDEKGKETESKKSLDGLVTLRNGLNHGSISLESDSDYEDFIELSTEFLSDVISGLNFFEKVSFGYISIIEVEKKIREKAKFYYKGKNLKGENFDLPLSSELDYSDIKETKSVIMKLEDKDNYLNLYPLYVFEDKAGKTPDIFYYNGYSGNYKFDFSGCRLGGKFIIDNSIQEKKELSKEEKLKRLTGEKKAGESESNRINSPETENELKRIFGIFTSENRE